MKKAKVSFIIIFFIIIVIPLAFFNFDEESVSDVDNKQLQKFPIGKNAGEDFTQSVFSYVEDRMGFREDMIKVYTEGYNGFFGELIHPLYIYGKDGFVFTEIAMEADFADWIDNFVDYLKKMQIYLNDRGVEFVFAIQPEKSTVYQKYLPDGYNYTNEMLPYLLNKLEEEDIRYVDNSKLLIEKAKTEQVYNVAYDANHWNDLGAFYGTNHILEELQKSYPTIQTNTLSDFDITKRIDRYLPISNFEVNEENTYLSLKNKLVENTMYNDEIILDEHENKFKYLENQNVSEDTPKVLMFQGSYLNGRYDFLGNQFKEYVAVHNYVNVLNMDYYFEIFQPDCVVFETAESVLSSEYFDYSGMRDKKYNPLINTFDTYQITKKKWVMNISKEKGKAITNIKIGIKEKLEDIDYAYIYIGDKIYDAQVSLDTKRIQVSVSSDEITDTMEIKLVTIGNDKKIIYTN